MLFVLKKTCDPKSKTINQNYVFWFSGCKIWHYHAVCADNMSATKNKKLDFFLGGGKWLESVNTLLNQFDEAIVGKGLKKAALCSLILFDASLAK